MDFFSSLFAREPESFSLPAPPWKSFSQLRKEGLLTDLIFKISGKNIPAHKLVLVAVSDYFRTALTGQFKESGQATYTLNDVDPQVFERFIDFLYGEALPIMDWRLILEIFRLMKFFQVKASPEFDLQGLELLTIPPDEAQEYLETLVSLYNGSPSEEVIALAASKVRPTEIDFSVFNDAIVEGLLKGARLGPMREFDYYQVIDRLVKAGRSPKLYRLVRFNYMTPEERQQILPEIIRAATPVMTNFRQISGTPGPGHAGQFASDFLYEGDPGYVPPSSGSFDFNFNY